MLSDIWWIRYHWINIVIYHFLDLKYQNVYIKAFINWLTVGIWIPDYSGDLNSKHVRYLNALIFIFLWQASLNRQSIQWYLIDPKLKTIQIRPQPNGIWANVDRSSDVVPVQLIKAYRFLPFTIEASNLCDITHTDHNFYIVIIFLIITLIFLIRNNILILTVHTSAPSQCG